MTILIISALAVRIAGIFWGFKGGIFTSYHPDENYLISIAKSFFQDGASIHYATGFPFLIRCVSSIVGLFQDIDDSTLILIGRCISVFFGLLTIAVIYLLAKEITSDKCLAKISSVFLLLSLLHVTQSHYATADACNVFWIYTVMYFSLLTLRRRQNKYFVIALICCGIGLSLKLTWISLVPIIYILVKHKKGKLNYVIALALISSMFILASGCKYSLVDFMSTIRMCLIDNVNVVKQNYKILNPFIYCIELIPAMSLPIFCLSIYGAIKYTRNRPNWLTAFPRDEFYIVVLPIALYAVSICFLDVPFPRHTLPMIPLACIVSSYGFLRLVRGGAVKKLRVSGSALLLIVIFYLLACVIQNEYYFFHDTRETASRWIKSNIPRWERIKVTDYVRIPSLRGTHRIVSSYNASFIVLHESYYYRYIRSAVSPLRKYPKWNEIYHGKYEDYLNIQRLFSGQLNYRLVKTFPATIYMPEHYVYKKLFGRFTWFTGDVLIYEQR